MATYKQIIELQAQTAKALKQIDRFVSAAEKKVQRLEDKIGKQQNILGRGGGRSVRRIDGERLQGAKVALRLRKQEADAVRAVLRSQQEVARQEENNLTRKLRLNAALRRQETLELAIKRAGTTGDRKERVNAALEEARAAKESLKVQQATNELLVKELQTQREINRTSKAQDARRSRITTDIKNRIARLKAIGVSESDLNKIIGARDELVRLNDSKQGDAANAQEARLNRLIKRQEELNKAYMQPTKQIASPIRGTTGMVGSPKYLEQQQKDAISRAKELDTEEKRINKTLDDRRKLRERAARAAARLLEQKIKEGGPSSPIRGTETMVGSPKYIAAEAKRLNEELNRLEKEENDINKALDKRRKLRENLARETARSIQQTKTAAIGMRRFAKSFDAVLNKFERLNRAQRAAGQLALPSTELLKPQKRGIQLLDLSSRTGKDLPPQIQQRLERNAERNKQLEKEMLELNKARRKAIDEAANAQYKANKQVAAAEKTLQQELQNIELRGIEESTRRKIESADRASKEDLRLQKEVNTKALRDFDEKLEKRSTIKRQRSRLREDLLLGAGFPLLFGGGPGAVLGGVGGALLGGGRGGFGAQIFGSAIGQQLDAVAQDALNTAKALTSTSSALNFVREKSLFSSKQSEELSYALEEQGDVAGLASLLTQELADKIGNNGVQSLVDLGAETDETTKLWNELTLQLQALISGPLKGFLELVNGFLTGLTTEQRFAAFQRDIAGDTQAQQRFAEIEAEVRGTTSRNVRGGGTQEVLGALTVAKQVEILNRAIAEGLRPTPSVPIIPQTPEDFRTIKPPTDRSADKARREEERLQERLKRLEAERVKVLEVSRFQDKIAAAVASGNEELEIRLRGEQSIAEIEQDRIKALAKVEDQREKDAINIKAATDKLAAQRQTERELDEAARLRAENYENTVSALQNQLDITTATTRQERERLEIEQQMKELRDSDKFTETQLNEIETLKNRLNVANQPLNNFITEATAELNDLEQVAVNIASGIGDAIGNSLANGISSLIEGSADVKEVFADMLKSVGQILVQEGTKMIATYIAIGIARAFAGLAGGGGAPDAGDAMGGSGSLPLIANPGESVSMNAAGGLVIPELAKGGPARADKPYMVGEEGPELFIPGTSGLVSSNDQFEAARAALVEGAGLSDEEKEAIENPGTSQQPSQLNQILKDSRSAVQTINQITKERETASVNSITKELTAAAANGPISTALGSNTTTNNVLKEILGGDTSSESSSTSIEQVAQAEAIVAARNALVEQKIGESLESLAEGGGEGGTGAAGSDSSIVKSSRDYIQKLTEKAGSSVTNNSSSSTFSTSRSAIDRVTALNQTRQMLQSTSSVTKERSVERASENQGAASMQPLDVRYESQVINNVEYVTAEQHRRGLAEAAERGRAMTLQTLQTSLKSRRKVGLA